MPAPILNFWRHYGRVLIYIVLVILFSNFALRSRLEVNHIIATIRQANVCFLYLGIAVTATYILAHSLLYQAALRSMHTNIPLRGCISVFIRRYFISTFIPLGFSASMYVLTDSLRKYKVSQLESHLASTIFLAIGYTSFILVLVPSIIYISFTGGVATYVWMATIIITALTFVAIWQFRQILAQRGFLYRHLTRLVPDFEELIKERQQKKIVGKYIWIGLIYSLVVDITSILFIYVAFLTVNHPITLLQAIIGYIISIIILSLSPIFQGVIVLEATLTYTYSRFGISQPVALAATLIYRLFQLWLPLLIGGFYMLVRAIWIAVKKPDWDDVPADV